MPRFDHNGMDIDEPCCPDTKKRVCFSCRRHVAVRLDTLANNLWIAGGPCAAFRTGASYFRHRWTPGCGQAVPR